MSQYFAFFTNAGNAKLAAAAVLNQPLNLTVMAVGDGSGAATTPSRLQTSLVNERFRAGLNRVVQDPGDASRYYLELLVPAAVGGFTIREFAAFDADGVLCVVGNFPAVEKVAPGSGAVSDLVVRVQVIVGSNESLTLLIDPAVAIATHSWVVGLITPGYLFPGGTTGQVLRKSSNADGDAEWADPSTAVVLVQTLEETQVATDGQTVFNLTSLTTLGLSVYIKDGRGGERIPRGAGSTGWQSGGNATQVVMGSGVPAGTLVTFVQNEPAGNLPLPLEASKNLSDVVSAATARTNLGVYSQAEADQLQPAGNVAYTASPAAPPGWLAANGALVNRTTYARLFAAIGTTYGAGNGSTTFALPDLRGEFIRGLDSGRGVDAGRAQGSFQADELKSHTHGIRTDDGDGFRASSPGGQVRGTDRGLVVTVNSNAAGGVETRPRNVALLAIIKF